MWSIIIVFNMAAVTYEKEVDASVGRQCRRNSLMSRVIFWSHDRVILEIHLFHEQDLRWPNLVVHSSQQAHRAPVFYIQNLRRQSGFHLFLPHGLFCLFLECMWLMYRLGRELSSWFISCTIICVYYIMLIGLVGRVFATDWGDRGSIPGRVIPKT